MILAGQNNANKMVTFCTTTLGFSTMTISFSSSSTMAGALGATFGDDGLDDGLGETLGGDLGGDGDDLSLDGDSWGEGVFLSFSGVEGWTGSAVLGVSGSGVVGLNSGRGGNTSSFGLGSGVVS